MSTNQSQKTCTLDSHTPELGTQTLTQELATTVQLTDMATSFLASATRLLVAAANATGPGTSTTATTATRTLLELRLPFPPMLQLPLRRLLF